MANKLFKSDLQFEELEMRMYTEKQYTEILKAMCNAVLLAYKHDFNLFDIQEYLVAYAKGADLEDRIVNDIMNILTEKIIHE